MPRRVLPHALIGLVSWWLCWPAPLLAADRTPAKPAGQDWSLSTDGAYLIQHSTRLMWSRCLAGMRWNGRDCVGLPQWADLPQAQLVARQRAQADALAWRLPHQHELLQLARLGAQPDQTLLPESSLGWVWSGSVPIAIQEVNPYTYENIVKGQGGQNIAQMKFLHGWVVNTATGHARDDVLRRTPMFVQLVRNMD